MVTAVSKLEPHVVDKLSRPKEIKNNHIFKDMMFPVQIQLLIQMESCWGGDVRENECLLINGASFIASGVAIDNVIHLVLIFQKIFNNNWKDFQQILVNSFMVFRGWMFLTLVFLRWHRNPFVTWCNHLKLNISKMWTRMLQILMLLQRNSKF